MQLRNAQSNTESNQNCQLYARRRRSFHLNFEQNRAHSTLNAIRRRLFLLFFVAVVVVVVERVATHSSSVGNDRLSLMLLHLAWRVHKTVHVGNKDNGIYVRL